MVWRMFLLYDKVYMTPFFLDTVIGTLKNAFECEKDYSKQRCLFRYPNSIPNLVPVDAKLTVGLIGIVAKDTRTFMRMVQVAETLSLSLSLFQTKSALGGYHAM